MSKHWKRSPGFYAQMLQLAQKLLGVHDKKDLKEAARLLCDHTTDAGCVVKAKSDEPIFTLQAGDGGPGAVALAAWILECEKKGLHKDKLTDARVCLREFVEYRP